MTNSCYIQNSHFLLILFIVVQGKIDNKKLFELYATQQPAAQTTEILNPIKNTSNSYYVNLSILT